MCVKYIKFKVFKCITHIITDLIILINPFVVLFDKFFYGSHNDLFNDLLLVFKPT